MHAEVKPLNPRSGAGEPRIARKGIVPPLLTPRDEGGRVGVDALVGLIDHVIGGGVTGLFVLGTTGEGPSLSCGDKREVVRRACESAAGRVPVLVGLIETSEYEIEKLAEHAAKQGASSLVLTPPFYFKIQQGELLGFVERVAPRLPLPVHLYNIPGLTKVAIEPDTVKKASRIPNVAGLKDSSGDMGYFAAVRALVDPEFLLYCGPEELLADAAALGADGGVCGGANLFPSLFVELFEAAVNEDQEMILGLKAIVGEMSQEIHNCGASYPAGLKEAMEVVGIPCGTVFYPLQGLDVGQKQRVRECALRLQPRVCAIDLRNRVR